MSYAMTNDEIGRARPPVALEKFTQRSAGISTITTWRYRKKGWLPTINICGRLYVAQETIIEFNRRAAGGEFAKTVQNPRKNALAA